MKIHSDILDYVDFRNAERNIEGITIEDISRAGSRSRKCAYNVYLSGSSRYAAQHRDICGDTFKAATYDEWGHFIARLYDIDTDAIIGPYKNSADFAEKTEWKFDTDND